MANVSALAQISNAAVSLSNLILVTPQETIGYQPQNQPVQSGEPQQPPPSILFHYEGEQTLTLESDITDHYTETNSAIQDQIALKPELITTNGFIGELNDVVPDALKTLKTVADKLTVVSGYTPGLSITAQNQYNEALQAYQITQLAINAAVAAWSSVTGGSSDTETPINSGAHKPSLNQTKQQKCFQQFYGYWQSRTLFTIQTPWAIFQNCAIKTLRAIQDADTRMVSNFEVTFKVLRFASTVEPLLGTQYNNIFFQGRLFNQGSNNVDIGVYSAPLSTKSFLGQVDLAAVA